MQSVLSGNLSINRAAEITRTTLQDRISGRVQHGKKPGPAPYLTLNEEKELVEYLLGSAELGYGKTRRKVKGIAESVAREKGVLRASSISTPVGGAYNGPRTPSLSSSSSSTSLSPILSKFLKPACTTFPDNSKVIQV